MADLDLEGNPTPKKEVKVDSRPVDGEPRESRNMIQLTPSTQGNELVIMVKMLEGIGRSLSAIALTLHKISEDRKNG